MSTVIRIRAWPRTAATGAAVAIFLAGGNNGAPHYDGEHYRAGIIADPRFEQSISFDDSGWAARAVPQASAIGWKPANPSRLDDLAALYWRDAAIEIDRIKDGVTTRRLTGTIAEATISEGGLVITSADLSNRLDKPFVTATFEGTGGIEGGDAAVGRVKRRSFGRVWNIEGRILDKANNIYEFGDPAFPLHGCSALRDKGRAGPLGILAWQGSIGATLAALQASEPVRGGGIFAPSIACGKWWTQPSGPLTADLEGEAAGYAETVPGIAAQLLAAAGGPAISNLAAAVALRPGIAGCHLGDNSETTAAALDRLLQRVTMIWSVTATGDIELRPWTFAAPIETLQATFISRERTIQPVYSRQVGYKKNERIHGDGEISIALLAEDVVYEDGTTGEEKAADLQDQITDLGGTVADQVDLLAQLQTDITLAETAISAAQANITTMQADAAAMQVALTQAQADIQSQGDDILAAQSDILANSNDISTMQTTLSSQGASITSLQTTASTHTGQIATINSTLTTQGASITANASAITTLQGSVASLSSTVSTQGASITANTTAITTLTGNLAEYQLRLSSNANNLLPNSSGEAGLRGWSGTGWSVIANNSNSPYFICTPTSVAAFVLTSDAIPMEANVSLTIGYETQNSGAAGVFGYADVICYDSSNAQLLDGPQNAASGPTSWGDRASRAISFTTPANTASVRVRLVASPTATSDRVRIRRVKLEKGTTWSAWSGEASVAQSFTALTTAEGSLATLSSTVATQGASITANSTAITTLQGSVASLNSTVSTQGASITANATAITSLQSSVATLTTRVSAGGVNLLPNGGLEDGFNSGVISAGNYSLVNSASWGRYAQVTATGVQAFQFALVAVSPSTTYTLSCDPILFGGASTGYVDVIGYNSSGTQVYDGPQTQLTGPFDFDTSTGRRGQIAITFTTPSDVVSVRCRFIANVVSGNVCGFRQMKLERGSTWSPYSSEASVVQSFSALSTLNSQYASLSSTVSTQGVTITSNSTAITTLNGNVTTLFGKYGFEIDVNGYVSGMVLNNNGSRSDVVWRVDKFTIGASGASSDTPFEVVGGVTYIKSAKIQSAAITTAKIADLAVDTLKIAGNAVTVPVSAYTAGTISCTVNTWTTIQSVTISASGGPITVMASCAPAYSTTAGATNIDLRISRDGTVIWSNDQMRSYDAAGGWMLLSTQISDTPSAGSHTYTLEFYPRSARDVRARGLFLTEMKR